MSDAYGVHPVHTCFGTYRDHPLTCILDATAPSAVKSAHRPRARAHAPHAHAHRFNIIHAVCTTTSDGALNGAGGGGAPLGGCGAPLQPIQKFCGIGNPA